MTQKFQRGFGVEILSRRTNHPRTWENQYVYEEAIIDYWEIGINGTSTRYFYGLLILRNGKIPRTISGYEEKFLKLICSNAEKGIKILDDYYRKTYQ